VTVIPKPAPGTALKAKRRRKAQQARQEQQVMREAKARDHDRCRACGRPGTDPAHLRHRGMGGNPAGDRTTRQGVIALCRACHRKFDAHRLEIVCLTDDGADGPVKIGGLTSLPVGFILFKER